MTGTIDVTPGGDMLLIRFPYREDLVDEMRTIPGRRWDKQGKVWKVPVQRVDLVVETFMKHGFALAPEVSGLFAGTAGSAVDEDGATLFEAEAPVPEQQPALTLSILNERVRSVLRGGFPDPVWVIGEVVDYDKAKHRRSIFFSLIEKRDGQDEPAAQAEVALFAKTAERLKKKLRDDKGEPWLRDGLEIRVSVRVDLYATSGRFQLIVEGIDPAYTLGQMALDREQILARLRAKGLAQRNRALPLPQPSLRVGVLTSPDSDAWNDFLDELRASGFGFAVTCFATRVQGRELRPTTLRGLHWFAERAEQFDVLCILRGGGSRTDLAWFDDEEVATAVAQHPLKVVCGIGHQRDESVLDAITESVKTPTAAAGLLIETARSASEQLRRQAETLASSTVAALRAQRRQLSHQAHALLRGLELRLSRDQRTLDEASQRARRGSAALITRRRDGLRGAADRLRERTRSELQRAQTQLEHHEARRRLLDPQRVLDRGYALVRNDTGAIIKDAATLSAGDSIEVALARGRARATTTEIITENESA
ncbi:MAG: exodeoxyribonuclease VII large subunit [Planctomycetota bacterium]